MLVDALAKRMGCDLRQHGVSLISVEGLNFDSFLPLFGDKALKIPVAVLTDADPVPAKVDPAETSPSTTTALPTDPTIPAVPATDTAATPVAAASDEQDDEDEEDDAEPVYPAPGDAIIVSANTAKMKAREDGHVKVFHGLKTFEYDLALDPDNRTAMLKALKELRPRIAKSLATKVAAETGDAARAKVLFCGMFERKQKNVQKGSFAQALAQVISDNTVAFKVPAYIQSAIQHVCQLPATPKS
jgi:putative ATP-dependent endonuclease of OLD family